MPITKALVVDVDGVVSPVHGRTDWGDDVTAGRLFGAVVVSPAMCVALDRLAAQPDTQALWLTDWDPEMREAMSGFPGSQWATVATRPSAVESSGWWKWLALDAWLREHPVVTTLVWVDDHLARPWPEVDTDHVATGTNLLTRQTRIGQALRARRIRALLVAPATETGLTREQVASIESWLR